MKHLEALLDYVGHFDRYQIFVLFLVCLAVILHSSVHVTFLFTAKDTDYRCSLPECDSQPAEYEPSWLRNAVPYKSISPRKCHQYFYNGTSSNNDTCSLNSFDKTVLVRCKSYVYKTRERSILQEYGLHCEENVWKLSMVGTINSVGQFIGLFIGGLVSDKYGRRLVLVFGMFFCGVCGILRTFMPTYEWFLIFEFLDAAFGAGTYICGFILGVELVSPKYRVLTGILVSCCYTVGEVFTAGSAWLVQSWKPLIYIIYTPCLLLLSYHWLIPDSVRWYISKGKFEEAKVVLKTAAKYNNKELPNNILEKLCHTECTDKKDGNFLEALKSTTLLLRLINCCFCWIACAFLFYGLTLNSVALAAGNSYLDFILTALIEIPAYASCNFILDTYGRRKSLSGSFLMTGLSCVAFIFISADSHIGSLLVYLLGKFWATAAFTNIYVITSEMFPTNLRQSFMSTCSTFGRLGSMIAPQVPLLGHIWAPLPLLSFAVMSFVAGLLTLLFPETSNIVLPDTIEEAENISKCSKKIITEKS